MHKIAVSSQTPNGLDAIIDARFGRCPFFIIVELDGKKNQKRTIYGEPSCKRIWWGGYPSRSIYGKQ
ncbi:MAG: NifB/NifX family molybdenum-iron cluster-binding protein [Candidatus Freyarchaeota archaeon]